MLFSVFLKKKPPTPHRDIQPFWRKKEPFAVLAENSLKPSIIGGFAAKNLAAWPPNFSFSFCFQQRSRRGAIKKIRLGGSPSPLCTRMMAVLFFQLPQRCICSTRFVATQCSSGCSGSRSCGCGRWSDPCPQSIPTWSIRGRGRARDQRARSRRCRTGARTPTRRDRGRTWTPRPTAGAGS